MKPRLPPALGRIAAAACVLATFLGVGPAQSASSRTKRSASVSSTRGAILDCTNRERARNGLSALRPSRTLRRAAQYHAKNMLRHRFFAHTDISGRTPADRVQMFQRRSNFHFIGENIAADYPTGGAACRSWIVSTSHRHTMLDRHYKWIGIGYASGNRGSGSYFVQDFGG
jgi:uncharacterized protein YkwD